MTDEVYFKGAMTTNTDDKFAVAPSKWNDNKNRFSIFGSRSQFASLGVGFGANSTGNTLFNPKVNDFEIHTVVYKDKVFTMTDTGSVYDGTNVEWGGDTTNLILFYGYNTSTPCRICEYKQTRDGVAICDYISAFKDGKVGMYDKVNKTFYENKGTGNFIAGLIREK